MFRKGRIPFDNLASVHPLSSLFPRGTAPIGFELSGFLYLFFEALEAERRAH